MATSSVTKLVVQLSPLPADFKGDPQKFAEALVARMRIAAPFGVTTFVTGPNKPTSNQGPWLKNGTQWYVWSDDAADYIPLDISDSEVAPYYIQDGEPPTDTETSVWIQTKGNGTVDVQVENVYVLLNGEWKPMLQSRGTTAQRPANPPDFFKYYDDDIQTLIWWERGEWRTVAGVKGDLKFVDARSRAEALTQNPGWEIFGTGDSENEAVRGRILIPAMKDDDGLNPIATSAGITARSQSSMSGAETHTLTDAEVPKTEIRAYNPTSGNLITEPAFMQNGPDGDILTTGNVSVVGAGNVAATNVLGKVFGGEGAHNNMPPTFAAFLLRKK